MPPKKTRIKDIARLAGVSIGTVDRVLHDRGEVAEKTQGKGSENPEGDKLFSQCDGSGTEIKEEISPCFTAS